MNKKRNMLVLLFILVALFTWGYYYLEYDMERLAPGGELIERSDSPYGKYKVKAYLSSGGATINWTVKGVVKNNETHKTRVIYWDEAKTAQIDWKNETTVIINKKRINVVNGSYDCRHD